MTPSDSESGTVLLVEDNPDDEFALRRVLQKAGIKATLHVAEHGVQAIDYLAGTGCYADRDQYPIPDLVLLDLKLPYKSGMEVLQWIREQPVFKTLPVVILSGSDEERDHRAALTFGANGYIVKPASIEEMSQLCTSIGLL